MSQSLPADEMRKSAEALLQRERLFSDTIIASVPGILYLYDQRGQFLRWNRSFETVSGYSHDEVAGMHPLDFFAGEEKKLIEYKISEVFAKGESSVEAELITKDGRAIPFFFTGRKVLFDGATCLVGMGIDITERQEAEKALRESERKYRELVEHANSIILRWTRDGRIIFLNEFGLKFFGYTAEEIVGQHVIGTIVPETESTNRDLRPLMDSILKDPEAFAQNTNENIRRNGERAWISWTNKTVYDEHGQITEILSIGTDITEKRKIEAQFLRSQRMESIGTLAGGIAHDLNNILAPIMLSIDILKTTASDPKSAKILETIGLSARRGADIVRQVLSFARGVEGERVEIQPKHLLKDLEQIIRDTFPKNIRLQFDVPSDTWTILGDPTQIHQVLLNLCVNARDAMPAGGDLKIEIENCVFDEQYAAMNLQAKPGRYVKFSVTDAGTGMPPEIIDKIFEPFFTTKDVNKGTGLGLSTVSAIVKSHEGLINVYSEQGKGTIFHTYFPAMETSAGAKREQPVESEMPRGDGETILLIDDEASLLTITSQTLQAHGYHILTALDGAEALAIYAQNVQKIDVVLTDMRMPVLDGSVVIQALMKINPKVKIIATSGLDANSGVARLSGSGVKHFLAKPYTAEALLKVLHSTLAEKES